MSQGGEKTEKPTDKRLRDARRKGQVARSQDLSSALLLLTAVAVFALAGARSALGIGAFMRDGIVTAASFKGDFQQSVALGALWSGVETMAWTLAPLFAALFMIALLVGYFQVGPVFSFQPLKPDMKKLNPAEGFKQKFLKSRPYLELIK